MRWVEKLLLVLVTVAWSYQQIVGEPLPSNEVITLYNQGRPQHSL